jgi:L-iditol 2-dehydrogenase/threonine 3-dehydrogenase
VGRLVYHLRAKNKVIPEVVAEPGPLGEGWVLGEFVSGTICSTDVTNMDGSLGHPIDPADPRILGHECCFRVIESRNKDVAVGQYIVPLGSDFHGFAEREAFLPILASTPDEEYRRFTVMTARGYSDPADERVKAVCVTDRWWTGISLIEPTTNVYTALLQTDALNARSVIVLGAGFCGQVAGLLCKTFGVQRVTLIDINECRLRQAVGCGYADDVEVDGDRMPGLTPGRTGPIAALIKSTEGMFGDVVFDALPGLEPSRSGGEPGVGGLAMTRNLGAQLLRPGGTWVMYGASEFMEMPAVSLLSKGIEVRGAGYDSRLINFPKRAAQMKAVLGLAEAGVIRLGRFIARHLAFTDTGAVAMAFQDYKTGRDLKVEIRGRDALRRAADIPEGPGMAGMAEGPRRV